MKHILGLLVLIVAVAANASDNADPNDQTVLGAKNPDLHDGAMQLRLGDPERGIQLTLRGLVNAADTREQYMAYSNLCAGYILVKNLTEAVRYCNLALQLNQRNHHALSNRALARFYQDDYVGARDDVDAGLALAPYSRSLKRVAQMIEDKVNPVAPMITIEHEVLSDGSQ